MLTTEHQYVVAAQKVSKTLRQHYSKEVGQARNLIRKAEFSYCAFMNTITFPLPMKHDVVAL